MGLLLNRLVDSFKGVGRMGRSMMAVLAVSLWQHPLYQVFDHDSGDNGPSNTNLQ